MTILSRAFLRPSNTIALRSKEERVVHALALLLEGRVADYQRMAPASGLPRSSDEPTDNAVGRLAQALLAFSQSEAVAMSLLADLLAHENEDAEARAVAAILQGILLSGLGRPDWAITTLRAHVGQSTDALTQSLLLLHLGLRSVEAGKTEEGLSHTADAAATIAGRTGSDAYTLRLVASANTFQFSWLAGRPTSGRTASPQRSPLFAWIFGASDDSLGTYLEETFASYFEDPYSRTVKFAVEDAIDVGLSQALLRCEGLAYRQGIIHQRKKLGRYRLLTETGQPGPGVSTGFELLRRAGDDKALRLALRTFRAAGPLEVLRSVGLRVSKSSWLEPELKATLEVIAATAFTFDRDSAASTFDRLMRALPDVLVRTFGSGWLVDSGFRALGGLLPLLDKTRTTRASEWLRQVAEAEPNPLVHQSMSPALHSMPWNELDRKERSAWLQFAKRQLTARDDRLFPARSVALELASTGSRAAVAAIYSAYRKGQSQWLAPLVVGMAHLSDPVRRRIVADVLASSQRIRERAHAGQYSFGGPELGALLARAARRFQEPSLYDELGEFVFDAAVPLDERIAAVTVLLDGSESVPLGLRRRLARGLSDPKLDVLLLGDPSVLDLLNLRLREAFGRLKAADALVTLLRYANDRRSQLRVQAAHAARELATRAPVPIGTLLLSLSHDQVPEVRGAAGRGLAGVRIGTIELDAARQSRIAELLQEPGELVPVQVWYGIAAASRDGFRFSPEIEELAGLVASRHIAQTVRDAAANAFPVESA